MRQDIYELFSRYEPQLQAEWNRIIASGLGSFTHRLAEIAAGYGLTQSTEGQSILWRDDEASIQAMFAFIIDPTDLAGIIAMYKDIQAMAVPVTFAIIEQREDGAGQYDIFRLSEKSYLEHCNRASVNSGDCEE